MSFIDLFKTREERAKLSHLKNLIAVAAADGKFEKSEIAAIAMVMERRGLKPADLERCIKNPKGIKFVKPKSQEQSVEYLKDMVFLMMCDGDIDEREISVCKLTAIALGFRHEVINAMIMDIISDLKGTLTKKQENKRLQILYFYMKSRMTDNQNALLKQVPLIIPMKRIDMNEDDVIQTRYNIRCWPTFVLVDSNGIELHRWQGLTEGNVINNYLENYHL